MIKYFKKSPEALKNVAAQEDKEEASKAHSLVRVRATTMSTPRCAFFRAPSPKGFTLMEILVVLTILSLLTTAFVRFNTSDRAKRQEVIKEVNNLNSELKSVRSAAIASKAIRQINATEDAVPEGGFGIYIDKAAKTFTFFADTADGAETAGNPQNGGDGLYTYTYPDDGVNENDDYLLTDLSAHTLGTNISVKSIKGDGATDLNRATIIFAPATTDIVISDNAGTTFNDLEIIIDSPSMEGKITINKISKFFIITTSSK